MTTPATERAIKSLHLISEDLDDIIDRLEDIKDDLNKDVSIEGDMADSDWVYGVEHFQKIIKNQQIEQLQFLIKEMENHK